MAYRIKIPPKELPADEAHLMSGMERLLDRLQEHRPMILVGLALLVLAAGVVGTVLWLDHRNAQQAHELLRQATQLYLDRPAGQPGKADQNLKQAIKLYTQVADEYARAPSAPFALYHLGNALVLGNDLTGAIATYKRFIANYGTNKILLGMVYQRLAFAYVLNGDREQAAKAFTAVLDTPGALNKDQAMFELGKLEEAQSRPEAALAHYQDLSKSYPQSPFAAEAAVRMKALEVKKLPESMAPHATEASKPAEQK